MDRNSNYRMPFSTRQFIGVMIFVFGLYGAQTSAREIHVAKTGDDSNAGDVASPYLTVNKAAAVAVAGDVILIHSGTYREWVKPAQGGTSEGSRITYKAFPGDIPVIKGSEQVTNWVLESGNVWRADIDNAIFGADNPYVLQIGTGNPDVYTTTSGSELSANYLLAGGEHHLGNVFLNGEGLKETFSRAAVNTTPNSWYTEQSGSTTKIWANFGGANPNTELAEILVRECVFAPDALNLGYVTLDGLVLQQAACGWAENTPWQSGMVKLKGGHHWIIENCLISDAKCAGISAGRHTYNTAGTVGWNIVRNNTIEDCGEVGIVGFSGWSFSIIEGNLIQNINTAKQFGGWEGGGIKFHVTTDLLIKGNIIRNIYRVPNTGNAPGIWVDWQNQGIRITGNLFYNLDRFPVMIEMSRGINTVDNNVMVGRPIQYHSSEKIVLAHNMLVNAGNNLVQETTRKVFYTVPHTLNTFGSNAIPTTKVGSRDYNNILITNGLAAGTSDYFANHNVYYNNATPLAGQDANSVVEAAFNPNFQVTNLGNSSVQLDFTSSSAPGDVSCPPITYSFIGQFDYGQGKSQGMEDCNGDPFDINTDMFGNARSATAPKAGPFENIQVGANSYIITAGRIEPNQPPVANDQSVTVQYMNTSKEITLSATDANAGDSLTYSIVANPANGTLSAVSGANVTYTPNTDYSGPDSFTFKANDGKADSNTATVSITVLANSYNPIVLVGGSIRNGDFNVGTVDQETFAQTPEWYNLEGNQDAAFTRTNLDYNGTQNAMISTALRAAVNTDHVIAEGDKFDLSYVWRDAWQWIDGTDQIIVSLFVTDDDTFTGVRTNLFQDYSGTSTLNDTYEAVNHDAFYTATAGDVGKTLFMAIETDSSVGFARIDNVELILIPGSVTTTLTVTYNGNGADSGSVPIDGTAYPVGGTVTVLGNTGSLVKADYTFTGWNTVANGGGMSYVADDTFTITSDTTLYAQWTPDQIADVSLPAGISLYGYTGQTPVDAQSAFQTLIDNSQLSLVRWVNPTTGSIKELYYTTFPSEGWVNEIGDLTLGQGYVVKTSMSCTLSIAGNRNSSSITHNLPSGYSIIGFNQDTPLNALTAFQPLIDASKLELVRWVDPATGSIKELYYTTYPSAGWVNEIGDLTEGQGYIIKLNTNHSSFTLP